MASNFGNSGWRCGTLFPCQKGRGSFFARTKKSDFVRKMNARVDGDPESAR